MTKSTAQHSLKLVDDTSDEPGQVVEDGYLIRSDQLKRLGNGDAKAGRRWLRILMSEFLDQKPISGPTPRPASVRIAGEADELAIFDLLVIQYRENVSNLYPLAPNRLIEDIQFGTQKKGGIIGVIDDKDGKPCACIVIVPARWPASNAYFLREIYTFVHPDHRKSRHAEHLIKFARWCAEEWGRGFGYPVHLGLSVASEHNATAKVRFFRRFSKQIGANFLYCGS